MIRWASPDDVVRWAEKLATLLQPGDAFALSGDLGAGKTFFTQSVVRALGHAEVTSPTFTLLNEYLDGRIPVYHADLYRIEQKGELAQLGFEELFWEGEHVVFVEWAEKFPVLPTDHVQLNISGNGEKERLVDVQGMGDRSADLVRNWTA